MTVETGHAIFQEHVPFNKLEMNTQLFWIARNYINQIFWKYLSQWLPPFV